MKTSAAVILSLIPSMVCAAPRTFTGGGADTNWLTTANWNPAGMPTAADNLVFVIGATTSNNNLSGATFHDLDFNARHSLTGNAFTLTSGITSSGVGLNGVTISPNITLGADQTFNVISRSLACGNILLNGHQLTSTGAGTLEVNDHVSGAGAASKIVKTGEGILRISPTGVAANAGGIALSAGTLEVLGFISTGPVNITGGKLTGGGNVAAVTATGGEIEPDGGDLLITAGLTLGAGAKVIVKLTGPGQADFLNVSAGAVTLGGAELVVDATAYQPVWDEDFTILNKASAGAIGGTFAGLPEGADVFINATTTGRIHYNGGSGNDVVIDIVSTTRTWDGGHAANDDWNEPENWSSNIAPHFGDVLVFPPGVQSTDRGVDNDFPNDTTFRKLIFAGDDFTVRGARFRLTHGMELAAGVTANLDTDCVFVTDQTITFGDASTLHLDLLDAIDITGRLVRLEGHGSVDGDITGDGEVTIGADADISYVARTTYDGITRIEAGGRLTIVEDGVIETNPGSDLGSVIIDGTFEVLNHNTVNRVFVDELIHMQPGGAIVLEGSKGVGGESVTELATNLTLHGPGAMTISAPRGKNEISGLIFGEGDLTIEQGVAEFLLSGPDANVFTGSLTVEGADVVAQKSAAGMMAISCGALTIVGDGFGGGSVETRQDEQIADNCQVSVGTGGTLRIGNLTARTETIGGLTIDGAATSAFQIMVSSGSLLAVRDSITVPAGTSDFPHGIAGGSLRIQGQPCLLNVAPHTPDPVGLFITSPVSRTAGASLRKTGDGLVRFSNTTALPFELTAGQVILNGNSSASPVALKGGTLGGTGTTGAVTSLPDGGAISPGDGPDGIGILSATSIAFNAATTLKIDVLNPTAGTGHDRLVASGPVSLGGAVLSLHEQPGFNVPLGSQLAILLKDGTVAINGTFAGLPEGGFLSFAGGFYQVTYTGGDGNDVVLTRKSQLPTLPTVTGFTFSRGTGAGGQNRVTLTGTATPNTAYSLETSSTLAQGGWTALQTVTAGPGGALALTLDQPANLLQRYYRFRLP